MKINSIATQIQQLENLWNYDNSFKVWYFHTGRELLLIVN